MSPRPRPASERAATLLLLVAILVHPHPATANPAPIYVSPLPDSRGILPATNLVARFDRDLDPASVVPGAISAVGSVSGPHEGRVVLSDDRRTIVFLPERPFAWGERVAVSLAPPRARDSGVPLAGASWSFDVVAAAPPAVDPMDFIARPPVRTVPASARPPVPRAAPDTLPADFPQFTSTVPGQPAPGWLFLSSFGIGPPPAPNYLLIVDDTGDPYFYREMPATCTDFKAQPDGRLTYYDSGARKFYAMDTTFAVVDSFACGNGYATDTHELRILPDGHALLIGLDPQRVDMSQVVPGGYQLALVTGAVIQELDTDKNVVFQWRSFDHFAITDATHEDLTARAIDYVHANALEVAADGNLILSSRHLDEITKIDRTSGAILWRWGGKNNQFTFLDDTLGFSHQHAIRRIANGDLTMFDNGDFHVPPVSRALEYRLDETQHTARLVWQYGNPLGTYGFAMGYVQRLENGDTLIGWGFGKPDVTEVTPDGTKVMEMTLLGGLSSYRASRSVWPPPPAKVPPPAPLITELLPGSPNPFHHSTRVTFDLAHPANVSVRVYDVTGRQVMVVANGEQRPAGVYSFDVDLSFMPAGVYLCRLVADGHAETRKLVLER